MELIIIFAIIFLSAIVCLISKNRILIEVLSVFTSFITFLFSIIIATKVSTLGVYAPYSFFSIDALASIVMLIIATVGLTVTVYSVRYLREETTKKIIGFTRVKQYFILLNLFLGAMFLAITSSSPIFTWVAIEATTLSTAFLISFYNKPAAMEAAWKYLIINSIGLLLAFFGTLLYYTSYKVGMDSGVVTWNMLLSNAGQLDPAIIKIAFVFILVGYGTKVGLAPMHTWLPDAHSKAPVPISALLSGVLLNVAFVALLRFKAVTDLVVGHTFSQNLLIGFGTFSILIAVFIIFNQKNYKRLLAYSSIENMGIITLGFGFGGLGVFAGIFHLIYHSLIKSALFLSAGNVFLKYSSTKIINVRGAIVALPITSILFLAGFFGITGTPPFGIFLTKIFIISTGMNSHPFVSILVILLTAILFVGFFKQVIAMIFGEKPIEIKAGELSIWLILPPLFLISLALILSFYVPPFLFKLINMAVLQY